MGFDPMTHRPRTDIFSSLPQLIALANLKELMKIMDMERKHQTWEEQALRLQQIEAVQMAKLQYLQYLLQPPTSLSNNMNSATDMDNFNLLNSPSSIKDNPILNPTQFGTQHQSSVGTTTLQLIHDSIPFSHLPHLQACGIQTPINRDIVQASDYTVLNKGENSLTSQWLPSTTSPSPSSPPADAPRPPIAPLIESSITNTKDACSTSSYEAGHSSFWPEVLLEDPLFHEMAKF